MNEKSGKQLAAICHVIIFSFRRSYQKQTKGGDKIFNQKMLSKVVICRMLAAGVCFLSLFNFVFFDILSMDKKQVISADSQLTVASLPLGLTPAVALADGNTQSIPVTARYLAQEEKSVFDSSYRAVVSVAGIPIKTFDVQQVTPVKVEAGGQSIGILLQTDGVSVVGFSPVMLEDGTNVNPAAEAGMETGDFITTINEKKINSNADIADVISKAGEAGEVCKIVYLRNGIKHSAIVEPLYCCDSCSWRIGLYVRDNTAGIGTLSFYDPDSGIYGALGHEVPDLEYATNGESKGRIVRAAVQGIKEGEAGSPGEKLGVFLNEDWQGSITTNSNFGVFGKLDEAPQTAYSSEILPVALPSEVETGKAEIYTVVEGETIESYDIEIVKCMEGYKLTGKGMVIKVTDEDLLEKTGGIVQGMSGSPIVQNGRFVGAVTHVFINDPTFGYACFGQWMLEDAGLM